MLGTSADLEIKPFHVRSRCQCWFPTFSETSKRYSSVLTGGTGEKNYRTVADPFRSTHCSCALGRRSRMLRGQHPQTPTKACRRAFRGGGSGTSRRWSREKGRFPATSYVMSSRRGAGSTPPEAPRASAGRGLVGLIVEDGYASPAPQTRTNQGVRRQPRGIGAGGPAERPVAVLSCGKKAEALCGAVIARVEERETSRAARVDVPLDVTDV